MYINEICLEAKKFLSKDKDTSLRHLCVEKDSVVATDGKVLVKIDTQNLKPQDDGDNGTESRVLLPPDALDALKKMVSKEENLRIAENEDKVVIEGMDSGKRSFTYSVDKVDQEYARYEKVFPEGSPQLSIQLSLDLLKKIVDFSRKYAEKRGDSGYIYLSFYGRKKPVKFMFQTENEQTIQGLLMPAFDEDKVYSAEGKDAVIQGLCELIDKREIAEATYSAMQKEEENPSIRKCIRAYRNRKDKLLKLFTEDSPAEVPEEKE